jgi:membrane-associated phospholipid phosphatase
MLAEGPLYILALLPIFWKHVKLTVFFAICELTGGAFLQILKHTICMPRPASVFKNYPDVVLPVVEGVQLHSSNSFPSGHASTFFIFFTCMVIFLTSRYKTRAARQCKKSQVLFVFLSLVFLFLAALGAYSRVYLSQHFLSDVCMGSFVGFVTTCLVFYFGRKKLLNIRNNTESAEQAEQPVKP